MATGNRVAQLPGQVTASWGGEQPATTGRGHGRISSSLPGTHRYQVTDIGLRVALFFTRVHARLFRPRSPS